MSARPAYMLDTGVFDAILDGKLDPAALAGKRVLVLGIQADEIRATPDDRAEHRALLLQTVEDVAPEVVPAASFAFDIEGAGFGQAYWNDGSGRFAKMLDRLKQLDKKPRNEKQHRNQIRDVLIAETAIKLGATLVTRDGKLAQMVGEFGGAVTTPSRFGMSVASRAIK